LKGVEDHRRAAVSLEDREEEHNVGRRGFTLLELAIVLTISATLLGFAALTFGSYAQRTSAQRAALVFVRDLALARSTALRSRESVVIRFYEGSRWYQVSTVETDTEVTRRRFGVNADVDLAGIDLRMPGDTLVFGPNGMADLSDASGSLGEAWFSAGAIEYSVLFNSMGAAKVEER
jgi:prepilin-type N-terminal cleavage/methylation domain-containing protein